MNTVPTTHTITRPNIFKMLGYLCFISTFYRAFSSSVINSRFNALSNLHLSITSLVFIIASILSLTPSSLAAELALVRSESRSWLVDARNDLKNP